jgi:hypothetical protein
MLYTQMTIFARLLCLLCGGCSLLFFDASSRALDLQALRLDTQLTPASFMGYFSDFNFKLREKTQQPNEFLTSKTGDCDDFSTLAANVLAEKGYTTHLIVVSMDAGVHVVCYVSQANAYLDYNNRATRTLVSSNGTLPDVAEKVAASFKSTWRTASEFKIANGVRQCLLTELR